jgi:hypothetical protein
VESCTAIVEGYDGKMELLYLGETVADASKVESPLRPISLSAEDAKTQA